MNQDILLSHNSAEKSEPTHTKTSNQSFQQNVVGKYQRHHNHNNSSASYNSEEYSPKQTILPTTTLTSDKSSSYIPTNRRTLASELAANDEDLSASLITTTRPPSSFNHQSLHSYASYRGCPDDLTGTNKISTSSSSSSTYGNGHNIWGVNSTNNNQDDDENGNNDDDDHSDKYSGTGQDQQGQSTESYAGAANFILDNPRGIPSSSHYRQRKYQHQFYSGDHPNRPLSPGQYFGARSLPLESMGDLWQQPSSSSRPPSYPLQAFSSRSPSLGTNNLGLKKKHSDDRHHSINQASSSSAATSYRSRSRTYSDMEPLWQNFKALPASLHHRHHWNRWEIHQQRTSTPRSDQRDKAPSSTPPPASSPLSSNSNSNANDMEDLMEKVQSLRIHDGNTTAISGYGQPRHQRPRQTSSYSLHPHDSVTIKCQISSTTIHTHDGHLTLTNHDYDQDQDDDNHALVFSLFSANGNVTFDVQSGTVSPGQTIDIWIRPRKRILHRLVTNNRLTRTMDEPTALFDESVALLVGQDLYRLKVNLDITVEEDDEEDDDDDEDDGDEDDRQQQQQQHVQDEQDKSGGDSDLDNQTTTPPVIGNHDDDDDDDDDTNRLATSTVKNQDPVEAAAANQDHKEPCPFCLLETLYPSS